jgi:hypothetical protein
MTSTITPPSGQQQQQQRQRTPNRQMKPVASLPPTGLQQQLAGMEEQYDAWRDFRYRRGGALSGYENNTSTSGIFNNLTSGAHDYHVGVDVRGNARNQNMELRADPGSVVPVANASTSLNDLARQLAQSYGLSIGRAQLVDEQGNFLFTPDQIAQSSGGKETLGTAAAKMNYIASAIQNQRSNQMFKKSEAALQAGLGLTGQRRAGSAVQRQAEFYQGLSALYDAQEFEAADFSYWIQKEKMDMEAAIAHKIEKLNKKKAQGAFWGGIVGAGLSLYAGDYSSLGTSIQQIGSSGAEAGYW